MRGLNLLLQSMGIKIDPVEIEHAWVESKDALPRLARAFDEMLSHQKRIEEKLDQIIATQRLGVQS